MVLRRWSGGKGGAEVFCFVLVQKWNGYRFFWGIMFVDMKRVLWETHTKISHRRTELCNISIFGRILFRLGSEVEWVRIFVWTHVRGHDTSPLGGEHKN